jgi:hypothetical protein
VAADLAQRAVERLDCVSRVDDFTDLWRVVEEGRQLIPSLFPAPADRGKTGIVKGSKVLKSRPSCLGGRGVVNQLQGGGDFQRVWNPLDGD